MPIALDAGEVECLIKVGDGDHLSAHVVSQAFRGRRASTSIRCFTRCSRVAWEGFCMRLHSRRLRLRMGGKQRQPQAKEFENP